MSNNQEITSLKRQFSRLANNPPRYNPWTRPGREKFEVWAQECREMEAMLRSAGVEL